jgi:hypothetical protein
MADGLTAGGVTTKAIAKWNGTAWEAMAGGGGRRVLCGSSKQTQTAIFTLQAGSPKHIRE